MATENLISEAALRRILLVMLLAAIMIAVIGEWTDIDMNLANAMYDRTRQIFPWRHTWLAERFSHEIMKKVLTVAACLAVATVLFDRFRPIASWDGLRRRQARLFAMACIGVPLLTSLLKRASASHCPWDLNTFGGAQPYVRLFDSLPPGILAGHCLPAGHASSALWLVAIGLFWLPGKPRVALAMSALGLAAGLALGWVQQLRGAHFLTHTLWSMWIACAVTLAIIIFSQYRLSIKTLAMPRRRLL